MKEKIKAKIVDILFWEADKILKKFQPKIIGITGNVGKTTTKDFIGGILSQKYGEEVRVSKKSENSEFGVALTIFGEKNPWSNIIGWTKILSTKFWKLYSGKVFPKILVLEIGADKPGDIKFLTKLVKPNTVVLTAFQETPTHGEYFSSIKQHIREKKYLVDALLSGGNLVFNADDVVMTDMAAQKENVNKYSFGKSEATDLQILENTFLYDVENNISGIRTKFLLKMFGEEKIFDIDQYGVVGDAQTYSLAASILVALLQNIDLGDIKNYLQNIEHAKSRMRILKGKNESILIDDSYNSSPIALQNGLETVRKIFTKGKKIVVLGHMAELGEKTEEAHVEAAKFAASVASIVVVSGRYNDFFLRGLREANFAAEKTFIARDANEVIDIFLNQNILSENDLVFIKGSQSARLEKVVVHLLKKETDANEVCRQDKEWLIR